MASGRKRRWDINIFNEQAEEFRRAWACRARRGWTSARRGPHSRVVAVRREVRPRCCRCRRGFCGDGIACCYRGDVGRSQRDCRAIFFEDLKKVFSSGEELLDT